MLLVEVAVFCADRATTNTNNFQTLKMRPRRCLETSGTKYPVTWPPIPAERKLQLIFAVASQTLLEGNTRVEKA